MRGRHKPWARGFIQDHPEWVIPDPESYKGHWQDAFSTSQPLHIELGMGKGQFIIGMAQAHPDINFIGIERQSDVLVMALEKAMETTLPNLKLLRMDVEELSEVFEQEEVDRIYLNFSDPWPKKRHTKRRLTYKSFLARYEKVLKKGGLLQFKTDHQGLFEYSLCSLSQYGMSFEKVSLDLHHSDFEGNVMTEYEERFSSMGHPIYLLQAYFSKEQE